MRGRDCQNAFHTHREGIRKTRGRGRASGVGFVTTFMSVSHFSAVGSWQQGWDEAGLREWAEDLRRRLGRHAPSLGLVFVSPALFAHARELLELIRVHAQVPVLAGCSSTGLIAEGREIEEGARIVLGLYSLPGARVHAAFVPAEAADPAAIWRKVAGGSESVEGWLAFVEPFQTDGEQWLERWQNSFPGVPVFGGLAAGSSEAPHAQIYCDGEVREDGGVVVGFAGVRLLGAVAQGCTPVGETWTITRVEENVIHRIGNRPAVAVLQDTLAELADEVKERARGNVFAGLVMDEYREDHRRGDFLVRSFLGADPASGALALAALPRSGQTLQFQLRDAAAADEDIREVLGRLRDDVGRARVYGGCLCVCAGRGQALFGEPDHDAGLVRQMIGPAAVCGFFCNGEFGPVGARSYVHSYTTALVLFVGPPRAPEDEL